MRRTTKIYLTSLDPHDNVQSTLDIPLASVLSTFVNALTVARFAAYGSVATTNPAGIFIGQAIAKLEDLVDAGRVVAARLGIKIDPIQFGDFKDPDVQYWSNVAFADTYYQLAATQDASPNYLAVGINVAGTVLKYVGSPAKVIEQVKTYFAGLKADVEKDAKKLLGELGAAAKKDATAAVQSLSDTFFEDASTVWGDLKVTVSNQARTALDDLKVKVSVDAKAAVNKLGDTLLKNADEAGIQLVLDVQAIVTKAVSDFKDEVLGGVIGRLDRLELDTVLAAIEEVAAITPAGLQVKFEQVLAAIDAKAAESLNKLIDKNAAAVEGALANFGQSVLTDAKAATAKLATTILQDLKDATGKLVKLEFDHTFDALAKLVALLKKDVLDKIQAKATEEFDKFKKVVLKSVDDNKVTTFTATPNGRSIPSNDVNKSLDTLSGFGSEDFTAAKYLNGGDPLGAGGPHSRVWQWYTGTINTTIDNFQGAQIWRRLSDTGIRATTFGIPLPGQEYSSTGWYYADPSVIINGTPGARRIAIDNPTPAGFTGIKEGVGAGFYFSPDGGGLAYLPKGAGKQTDVKTENATEAKLDGAVTPNLETVFNGNFEQGIKQSLFNHLYDPSADWGRFPISYQLPGWSFHGGSGFKLDASITLPDPVGKLGGLVDVTGLFVVPTNAHDQLKPLIDSYITSAVDKVVGYLEAYYKNKAGAFKLPPKPDIAAGQDAIDRWNANYGDFARQFVDVDKFIAEIDKWLQIADNDPGQYVAIGGLRLDTIFALDGELFKESAVNKFKDFLIENADTILKSVLPSAGSGLLFGGKEALTAVLKTGFNLASGNDPTYSYFVDNVLKSVLGDSDFSTLTHDRIWVSKDYHFLNFNAFVPLAISPDTQIDVTITVDDNGEKGASAVFHEKIDGAFFHDFSFHEEIPAEMQGHMVLISFHQSSRDAKFVSAPTLTVADALNSFSSLFILENVRLGATPDANEYAKPEIGVVPPGRCGGERDRVRHADLRRRDPHGRAGPGQLGGERPGVEHRDPRHGRVAHRPAVQPGHRHVCGQHDHARRQCGRRGLVCRRGRGVHAGAGRYGGGDHRRWERPAVSTC